MVGKAAWLIAVLTTLSVVCTAQTASRADAFVLVAGGTFGMGSNKGNSDELPVHSVTVASFYIGKYEVTQAEWVRVMAKNPSDRKGDTLPLTFVTWMDALEYCNRLSVADGLTPCYAQSGSSWQCDFAATGYRLPTEAEWEYAARGGSRSHGYSYSGGESAQSVGWYKANSGGALKPIGAKGPNELGLHDMSGNVYEWCWDLYGAYASVPAANPVGAAEGLLRVYRGGSWDCPEARLRACARRGKMPWEGSGFLGLRLVRSSK